MEVHGYSTTLDEILKSSNIFYCVQTRKDIHVLETKETLDDKISDFESLKLSNHRITLYLYFINHSGPSMFIW